MVGSWALFPAEGAPGGCRGAVEGDVAPPRAPAAEGAWSGLLEGLGLVAEAHKADPMLVEAGCRRLPTTASTTDGRRSLCSLKRARVSAPPSHLASEKTRITSFSASSSYRRFRRPPLPFPM